jgi:hypothetical protein
MTSFEFLQLLGLPTDSAADDEPLTLHKAQGWISRAIQERIRPYPSSKGATAGSVLVQEPRLLVVALEGGDLLAICPEGELGDDSEEMWLAAATGRAVLRALSAAGKLGYCLDATAAEEYMRLVAAHKAEESAQLAARRKAEGLAQLAELKAEFGDV